MKSANTRKVIAMEEHERSHQEKKTALFLEQKKTLDIFLANGAITVAQYNKSYGDLVKLMGMEEIAKSIEADNEKLRK